MHADVKPGNINVNFRDNARLGDFNLSESGAQSRSQNVESSRWRRGITKSLPTCRTVMRLRQKRISASVNVARKYIKVSNDQHIPLGNPMHGSSH